MHTVKLLCAAGVLTHAFADKVQELADAEGCELKVSAGMISKAKEECQDADLILLGPQVGFELATVEALFPDKPVQVIAMEPFMAMDAAPVLRRSKRRWTSRSSAAHHSKRAARGVARFHAVRRDVGAWCGRVRSCPRGPARGH